VNNPSLPLTAQEHNQAGCHSLGALGRRSWPTPMPRRMYQDIVWVAFARVSSKAAGDRQVRAASLVREPRGMPPSTLFGERRLLSYTACQYSCR
jgi:hypothetical protein